MYRYHDGSRPVSKLNLTRMVIIALTLLAIVALFFLASIDQVNAAAALNDYGYPYPAPITSTPGSYPPPLDPRCQEAQLLEQPLPVWCLQTQPPTPTVVLNTQPQSLPTLPAVIQRRPGKGPKGSKKGMP
jgi:hypothetical protein